MKSVYVLVSQSPDSSTIKVHGVYEDINAAIPDAVTTANVSVVPVHKDSVFQNRWRVHVPETRVEIYQAELIEAQD